MKPRLLDLFAGAGGAAMGYHRAGWDVTGVDIVPQEHYPFTFWTADALEVAYLLRGGGSLHGHGFDAIHASPPCQFGTAYRRRPNHVKDSPNLIPDVRHLLQMTGLPYVIENNWTNRAHLIDPIRLCGSSFGLDVQRHRAFESNVPLIGKGCDHSWQTPRFPPATNRTNLRRTVEVGAWRTAHLSPAAMGIDWMTNDEISEAIPPAYTEWIGEQLMDRVDPRCTFLIREVGTRPADIHPCRRRASEHPVKGEGRFANHEYPIVNGRRYAPAS